MNDQQINPRAFFHFLPTTLKTLVVLVIVGIILLYVTAPDRPSAFAAIVVGFSAVAMFGTVAWAYRFTKQATSNSMEIAREALDHAKVASQHAYDQAAETAEITSRIVEIAEGWQANPRTREIGERAMEEVRKARQHRPDSETN